MKNTAKNHMVPALLLLALLQGAGAGAKSLAEDSKGLPNTVGRELPAEQFVVVPAQKLKNVQLLYLNKAYLQENGYDVTNEKDLAAAVAEWSFAVPGLGDAPESFDPSVTKNFYASRYGGGFLGVNLGDGRAAASGKFQIKGFGRTVLAKATSDHANGKTTLEEAMREAIFGEINHYELPYGSNRVIAIISRGTFTRNDQGELEPDAEIIREGPLRPAQFMDLGQINGKDVEENFEPAKSLRGLLAALPVPASAKNLSASTQLKTGLAEFSRRAAWQYATAFAKGLFHGATSPSNIEISGRFLDFGTETAQPGHGKIKMLEFNDAAGVNKEFEEMMVQIATAFADRIQGTSVDTEDLKEYARSNFGNVFKQSYEKALRFQFLTLLGVPTEVVEALAETAEGRELADTLIRLATAGAKDFYVVATDPVKTTKYDFQRLVQGLTEPRSLDGVKIKASLKQALPELSRNKALIERYVSFQKAAQAVAQKNLKMDSSGYLEAVAKAAQERNRPRTTAYRWNVIAGDQAAIKNYVKKADPKIIQAGIDQRVKESLRDFKTPAGQKLLSCKSMF
jgi:uncharacterized protein YdiU (UPF0061 family)